MKMSNGQIRLSPSALNLFLECPKCFWLEHSEGIHRPRGIFPSLPSGMDSILKVYFDKYRAIGKLPPEIEGKVEGVLFPDMELLNNWRNWRTGLVYEDRDLGAILIGALDDLLINPKTKLYMPFDFKTRGFDLKEDSTHFYQNQIDCYALMLEANGLKTAGVGYLAYYIPKEVRKDGNIYFETTIKKIKTDLGAAKKNFEEAVKLLKGPMPKSHSACAYCSWGNDFLED